MTPNPNRWTAAAVLLLLGGCAAFSPDGGIDRVSTLSRERTGVGVQALRSPADAEATAARVAELLKAPLTADTAVELALLNHRGLQAQLAGLGIAEADLVAAGRLRNPVFAFGRLAGGGALEIDRSLMFDLLGLLTMPAAKQVQGQRFEQAQLDAAAAAVALATRARVAFFNAVAAQQRAVYFEQVGEAADAAAELAKRMQQAGNFSRLEQLREQAFEAEARAGLTRARQAAVAERERLARVLGGLGDFTLPERLPELPASLVEPARAGQAAIDHRLDVQAARRAAEASAAALGLTRATRYVNALELGAQNRSERGAAGVRGYTLSLELPLFDGGSIASARAEAGYRQAMHQAAAVALDAASEVREAHAAYRSAYELARHHRDALVPLKQRVSEEQQLRYNGMLISVFELLAEAREQIRGVADAVEAQRDFWIADAQLQAAVGGR